MKERQKRKERQKSFVIFLYMEADFGTLLFRQKEKER